MAEFAVVASILEVAGAALKLLLALLQNSVQNVLNTTVDRLLRHHDESFTPGYIETAWPTTPTRRSYPLRRGPDLYAGKTKTRVRRYSVLTTCGILLPKRPEESRFQ